MILFRIIALSTFAATAQDAPDLCTCLTDSVPLYQEHMDGGVEAVFPVPAGAVRERVRGVDSQWIVWTSDQYRLRYSFGAGRVFDTIQRDRAKRNWCARPAGGSPVLVEDSLNQEFEYTVSIADTLRDDRVLALSITSGTASGCAALGHIVNKLTFVNDLRGIRVISVAGDKKSFVFHNEANLTKTAVIGDLITHESGKVVSITNTEIIVVELVQDGKGGYTEVERRIAVGNHR